MLNPIPIQFLALFAYFILRVFVGAILFYLGITHIRYFSELKHTLRLSWWSFGTLSTIGLILTELALGLLITAGAYTQYATLILAALSIKMLIVRNWIAHHSIPPKIFWFLLLGASLTLFITGAGVPAVDLPL